MTALTKGIPCPANEWTLLSEAKMKVTVVMRTVGGGRVVTASAKPVGAPDMDYLTVSNARPASLQFEDTTTNVYFWTDKAGAVAEVITE